MAEIVKGVPCEGREGRSRIMHTISHFSAPVKLYKSVITLTNSVSCHDTRIK